MNNLLPFGWSVGGVVDIVIVLTLIECAALVAFNRVTGRGLAPKEYSLNLASGLCLMLALRCAVSGTGAGWVILCLSAAGLAHGADIWRRWK